MVQIEVLQFWSGEPSGFRQIVPGVYDAKDERLYGCAGYLLKHGYARRVESEAPAADDEEMTREELEARTTELMVENLHKELGVPTTEEILFGVKDEPETVADDSQDEPKHRRRSK